MSTWPWANHVGSMLLEYLDSDAARCECCRSSSPMPQPYKTSPETLANTHRSLGTSPRQDYTHRVKLNDCVSARWSPMYQYLALTSLRDSHPLPTRHIREPIDGFSSESLPYFRFRTSVSVLPFSFQRFPLAPLLAYVCLACQNTPTSLVSV